eukprot:6139370-Pyramimonas_sp.AAC.1
MSPLLSGYSRGPQKASRKERQGLCCKLGARMTRAPKAPRPLVELRRSQGAHGARARTEPCVDRRRPTPCRLPQNWKRKGLLLSN